LVVLAVLVVIAVLSGDEPRSSPGAGPRWPTAGR